MAASCCSMRSVSSSALVEVTFLECQLRARADELSEAVAAVVFGLAGLEDGPRAGEIATQEPDGAEERRAIGLARTRAPPLGELLVGGLESLLRLAQVAAPEQRPPAPEVDAEDAEQRTTAVGEREQLLPSFDRLIAIRHREHHQRGNRE